MSDYIVIHGIKVHKDHANFVPETFGRLTTIGPRFMLFLGREKRRRPHQVCQCSCGNAVICQTHAIKSGNTQSCGCLCVDRTKEVHCKHGKSATALHSLWRSLLNRCSLTVKQPAKDYAARGIGVCARWREPNGQGFINFCVDMGPRPGPEYTVDRYPDKNGNYEPSNCRWATPKEQARNTRTNRMLTAFGRTQCMAAWAEEYGIEQYNLEKRLRTGWDIEKALNTPVRQQKNNAKKNT